MPELLTREAHLELQEDMTVAGLAVPYNTPTNVGGYREQIARGAAEGSTDVKLFSQHREVIGKVTKQEEREEGLWIEAKISDTTLGRDSYTLLKDQVIDSFSIGFLPVEETQASDGLVTRTKIQLREVSCVTFPAYKTAKISEVREDSTNKGENMTEEVNKADLSELREDVAELTRSVALLDSKPAEPAVLTRNFGELVKGLAEGDEAITRAYEGAISADAVMKDAWVGSFVEILHKKQTVANAFARDTTPATGLSIEYAELGANTISVTEQVKEGDNLAFGKVAITTKTAPIKTFGGYSSLSKQVIDRSTVGILNTTFEALTEAASRRVELNARAALTTALTTAATVDGDLTTQDGVVKLIVDLVEHFDDLGLTLDGLFLDKATFLALYAVKANGRVLQVTGAPTDKVGNISVTTAAGDVAGVKFEILPGAEANTVAAYNSSAIKTFESPQFKLQDENIVNLTGQFSSYLYGNSVVQRPSGLVKVI